MSGTDRDDVVAIVAHLTRIAVRHHAGSRAHELAAEICGALCAEFALEPVSVATAGREMAAAMSRPA